MEHVFNVMKPSSDSILHLLIRQLLAHFHRVYFWLFSLSTFSVRLFRLNPTGSITCSLWRTDWYKFIFLCSSCAGGMERDATTILTKTIVFPLELWADDEWDLQKKGTWTQLQEIWNPDQKPESNMITHTYVWQVIRHMTDYIGLPLLEWWMTEFCQ